MSSTFSITGFGFSFDDNTSTITAITGPATLSLTFAEAAPVVRYTRIFLDDDGVLPDVALQGDQPTGVTINGVAPGQDADPSIGRVTWDDNGTPRATDIFNIYVSEEEQYAFVVGGDPLPEGLDAAGYQAILMSAIANNGGVLPLPLPPASSIFPPDADIALTGLAGWTQEPVVTQEAPVALTLTGISFDPDGFEPGGDIDLQETQLSFALPSGDVTLSYTQVGLIPDDFPGDGLAEVQFDFSAPPLGLSFGGLQRVLEDGDYSLEMGRFTTTAGTHDILLIDDNETGRQYLFQLGGVPLSITSQAEFEAFFGTVTSLDPIPDGTPLGQGQTIVPGDLPGATTTPLVPYVLGGYQVGYDTAVSDDPLSIAPAEMTILAPPGAGLTLDNIGPAPEGGGSLVVLGSPGPFFVQVPGLDVPTALQTVLLRLTDTAGISYDILEFLNPTGGDANLDFFFQLAGPQLSFDTLAEFNAFRATITTEASILPGDPLGPDALIPLAGLGFAPGEGGGGPDLPAPSGDPAIVQFEGYRLEFDESGDDLTGYSASQMTIALVAENTPYSYVILPNIDDEGPDPVDIFGPDPYALLFDGLPPSVDPVIGFERLTVGGVDYDVVIVQVDDVFHVFQIDGGTPLPFNDLAAVADFLEAADEPGGFGPIPPGSPFAPGAVFDFGDSPYATVSTDPVTILGGDEYGAAPGYGAGDGPGTEGAVTVLNGQTLTLSAGTEGQGPFLNVGRGAGAIGTATVAGPDSTLEMVGGGSATNGAHLGIGADGGTGIMRLIDGGRFEMRDPTGPAGSDATGGGESANIGRGAGSQGLLDIFGGAFVLQGSGAGLTVGRDGGEGEVLVENGGSFRVQTTSAGTQDFTALRVGHNDGAGLFAIDHGLAIVQAGDNANGAIDIGRNGGAGGVLIGGSYPQGGMPEHGMMITGGANSSFVEANVGRMGAGMVEVAGGFFGVLNRGVTYDDDLNLIDLPGDGGGAAMRVGRYEDGTGLVQAFDGGEIFVVGQTGADLEIGAGAGSNGAMSIDNGLLNVLSSGGTAGVMAGAWDGGTGLLELTGGATGWVEGETGAFVNIGRGAGNTGELVMEDGSHLLIRGLTDFTSMEVGAFGGAGAATVLSGATIRAEGANTFLGIGNANDDPGDDTNGSMVVNGAGSRVTGFRGANIGATDGDGSAFGWLRVEDGAAVQLGADDTDTSLFVGRGAGAEGVLEITDALMSIYAPDGGFQPYTAFGYQGGTAEVDVTGQRGAGGDTAHGFIQLGGGSTDFATLDIGRGAGSSGVVNVAGAFFGTQNNGTSYSFDPPHEPFDQDGDGGRAVFRIGIQGGEGALNAGPDTNIFAQGGAEGAAFIVGETGGTGSFELQGGEWMIEGADSTAFLGIGAGGTGAVTLSEGARGRIELLSAESGLGNTAIAVGYEGNAGGGRGDGTLILEGMMTELELVSAGDANLHVGGIENGAGDGVLRIRDGATMIHDSVGHQQLNIGQGGGEGLLEVLDGGTFSATTTGPGFDTFMLVGTEGGEGAVVVDNAALALTSQGGNAGVRIGTRFTHTDDNTGTGSFVLENGAGAVIEGATGSSFWVGGLEDGNGSAVIRSGADLALQGPGMNLVMVGGVFGVTDAPGGSGTLEVTGADSSLTGANTFLVGFNNTTGSGEMSVTDGASVEIGGGSHGLFGIGLFASATGNGGTGSVTLADAGSTLSVRGTDAEAIIGNSDDSSGSLTIENGAQMLVEAGLAGTTGTIGALMEIGKDGGAGNVALSGAGSALTVTNEDGSGGAIRIAAEGAGSFGLLHIAGGAEVSAGMVEVGAADAKGVLVLDDGGSLAADTITIAPEGVLGGSGTITGDVEIVGGSVGAGDTWDPQGGPTDGGWGIGTLLIEGDLTQIGGAAYFDFGTTGNDLLDVTGALSFANTDFVLQWNGDLPDGVAVRLARAGGGISLDEVTLASTPFDGVAGAAPGLELREGDTELWFVAGADVAVPTGPALTLTQVGDPAGTTITYAVSVDPALVAGGVLQDLEFTLGFNPGLIGYVEGSISGDFTAEASSLVISGSDLDITDLDAPVLTFDMALTELAGARDVSFDLTQVSVNGNPMEDQAGAADFTYDAAFFELGGMVDIRDVRETPTGPEGTALRFTTAEGAVHETTTDAGGAFSFGLFEAGTAGELEIMRDYQPGPGGADKAPGIQDVLGLFRMVVGVPGLEVDASDIVAADFDRSGGVDIGDVLALFRHVVDVPGASTPEFVFADTAADLDGVGLGDVPALTGTFDIGPIAADTDLSFLGILTGDLQGHL